MKKCLYIFATTLAVLPLGSCSNDSEDLEVLIDPKTGIEVINEPVEIKLGTPSVNITRAALDDDSQDITIGVFCLAREKQRINNTEQDISWWDASVDPLYRSTFCLLKNVKSTKSGENVTWDDGTKRFYPITQFYSYDFYTYYPYVAFDDDPNGNSIDTTTIGIVYVNYPNLDGKTDILWGRASSDEDYAFSAKYFRQSGNQSKTPITQLDHMLTRLKFQVVPGEEVVGGGDYSAAADMIVTCLKVKDVVKNVTLTLANFTKDSANEQGSDAINGTDEPDRLQPSDDEVQTLSLCGADGNPFSPVQVSDNPVSPQMLGESFLLYPASKYVFEISLRSSTTGLEYHQDHPLELVHPNAASGGVFEAGHQYTITIEVHGPKEVKLKAQLTPWIITDPNQIEL